MKAKSAVETDIFIVRHILRRIIEASEWNSFISSYDNELVEGFFARKMDFCINKDEMAVLKEIAGLK